MISDERLEQLSAIETCWGTTGEMMSIAKELLALRKNRDGWKLVPDGFVIVPCALTAENGAKGALLGEFHLEYMLECHECFGEGCDDCSGEGRWINSIPVDWTTIKEIWTKGVEHFQAAATEPPC